jgi:hypothetical protein
MVTLDPAYKDGKYTVGIDEGLGLNGLLASQ